MRTFQIAGEGYLPHHSYWHACGKLAGRWNPDGSRLLGDVHHDFLRKTAVKS
jgi:hypothetical protein